MLRKNLDVHGKPEGSATEIVVGQTRDTITEATLDELVAALTGKEVARLAIRQHIQDAKNEVRADWRNGGKRAAKEKAITSLEADAQAGKLTIAEYTAAMRKLLGR